jgi:hypothetical protein
MARAKDVRARLTQMCCTCGESLHSCKLKDVTLRQRAETNDSSINDDRTETPKQ